MGDVGESCLWMSRRRRGYWGSSVTGGYLLVDLVCQGVSMENNCHFLHSFEFGSQCPNVHPDVFCEDRWTKWGGKMILDVNFSVILDVYLVNQMHLGDWKPDLLVDNLLKLLFNCLHSNHIVPIPILPILIY